MKALALKVRILLLYFGFCSLIPFKMGSIDYLPWKKKAHLIPQKKIHPIPQKEIPPYTAKESPPYTAKENPPYTAKRNSAPMVAIHHCKNYQNKIRTICDAEQNMAIF